MVLTLEQDQTYETLCIKLFHASLCTNNEGATKPHMLARCMKQCQYLWEIQQTIKMALSYVYAKLQ